MCHIAHKNKISIKETAYRKQSKGNIEYHVLMEYLMVKKHCNKHETQTRKVDNTIDKEGTEYMTNELTRGRSAKVPVNSILPDDKGYGIGIRIRGRFTKANI